MDTGIFKNCFISAVPPWAIPENVENSTITKISSQDAPAKIICGILFFVPYPLSMSCTILGTTTAGDTAARTAPMTAASILVIPRIIGAQSRYPQISKLAGTNDIMTAGRPTFFRSARFKESPAFNKIIIRAICRSSDEIDRILSSRRPKTCGPRIIPVNSIPIIRGSRSPPQIAAAESPTKNINAREVNIITGSPHIVPESSSFSHYRMRTPSPAFPPRRSRRPP